MFSCARRTAISTCRAEWVGGAFLLRYGDAMKRALHADLAANNKRFVERGEVIQKPPCGSPY